MLLRILCALSFAAVLTGATSSEEPALEPLPEIVFYQPGQEPVRQNPVDASVASSTAF